MPKYTWYYKGMRFDNQSAKLYAAGVRDVPRMICKDGDIWGRAGCYLKITRNPDKMSYHYGDALDLTGIQVMLICPEQGARDVTELCAFDPANGEMLTDKNVKVTFTEDETTLKTWLRLDVNWPENITASGGWWTLYDNSLLHIYCAGDMPLTTRVSLSLPPWSAYQDSIQRVIIANSVTSIGNFAFIDHASLTNVFIPNSVTFIGTGAFRWCQMPDITIPNSVTRIGAEENNNQYYGAFHGCGALTSVTIPGSVQFIETGAFAGCASLKSAILLDGVTAAASNMFSSCASLTSVTLPDSVTKIGASTFVNCSAIKSITIPESVTEIGENAFSGCHQLSEVNIPDGVTKIGAYTFVHCHAIKSITIPESVTEIGENAFFGCRQLSEVNIPDGVTKIGESAFSYCNSLTDITIPESVTEIGASVFSNCANLDRFTYYARIISDSMFRNCPKIGNCIFPNITSIGDYAFENDNFAWVDLPDGLTSIGKLAFYNCLYLSRVTIPLSVTSIGYNAFSIFHYGKVPVLHLYYAGSQEQWTALNYQEYRSSKRPTLTIHYNSTGPDDA